MKLMTSKYKGTCAATGAVITAGSAIAYDPVSRKTYAKGSPQYGQAQRLDSQHAAEMTEQVSLDTWMENRRWTTSQLS